MESHSFNHVLDLLLDRRTVSTEFILVCYSLQEWFRLFEHIDFL